MLHTVSFSGQLGPTDLKAAMNVLFWHTVCGCLVCSHYIVYIYTSLRVSAGQALLCKGVGNALSKNTASNIQLCLVIAVEDKHREATVADLIWSAVLPQAMAVDLQLPAFQPPCFMLAQTKRKLGLSMSGIASSRCLST